MKEIKNNVILILNALILAGILFLANGVIDLKERMKAVETSVQYLNAGINLSSKK